MQKLNTPVKQMVMEARSRIEEIETSDAIAMVEDPNVVIVDLRDVRERQRTGYVPGSFHCPRGMAEFWVDPESPYFKEIFSQDKTFVFHCASGWRSALTVDTLNKMGFRCAAVVLAEHAPDGTDVMRAVRMALVHDLVEIDAGDTFAFDVAANADKDEREQAAANRLFSLLPAGDSAELRSLWEEFEAGRTLDARYAVALDRFAGLLQNWAGDDGGTWHQYAVTRTAVLKRMDPIRTATPRLWPFVIEVVEAAAASRFLGSDDSPGND